MNTALAIPEPKPLPANLAKPLDLDLSTIEKALAGVNPTNIALDPERDGPLFDWADQLIVKLITVDPLDKGERDKAVASFTQAGANLEKDGAHKSDMLKGRIGKLKNDTEDGGPVAVALLGLRNQVERLNPTGIDFSNPKAASRKLLGLIPLGNKVQEYFSQYETADAVIADIVKNIKAGQETLVRDNITLKQDRDAYWAVALRLAQVVKMLMAFDARLSDRLENDAAMDAELRKFLEEEVLFECRQRIGDLQQRLLLKINGTASSDILMKTNKELIRGVDRALFVTVDALNIVVAIALALTNQKLVLRSLDALNETTNKLLVSASELMQKQAAVILEQGAKGMLSQKALEQVFVNIFDTFDQISRFKQQALPEMSSRILAFSSLTDDAMERVRQMDRGNQFSDTLALIDPSVLDRAQ